MQHTEGTDVAATLASSVSESPLSISCEVKEQQQGDSQSSDKCNYPNPQFPLFFFVHSTILCYPWSCTCGGYLNMFCYGFGSLLSGLCILQDECVVSNGQCKFFFFSYSFSYSCIFLGAPGCNRSLFDECLSFLIMCFSSCLFILLHMLLSNLRPSLVLTDMCMSSSNSFHIVWN
jgi:hypothetical protein